MTVRITKLSNGLTIVTDTMAHLETVSLGVWFGAGARQEREEEHGIAHFLEHMAFKGTPTRSARKIAEEIEAVGGDLNAATSLEHTSYYVRILKEDVGLALNILSDILQNPLFDEDEIAREQDVILQEIAAVEDSPDEMVYDLLQEIAFADQALGRPILGTPESVMSVRAEDLRRYMERNYSADNMVIGAAGAVDHDKLVAMAEQSFSGLNPSGDRPYTKSTYTGGSFSYDKALEQTHIILAFEGLSYSDTDYYATQVLSGILGGGMSSRLFQEIREKRGLCYAIYSFSWGLSDTGLFGIHAATSPNQAAELSEVIGLELSKAAMEEPTEAEVARAKAQLKAGLLMSLESSNARAEQLARQMLAFGKPLEIPDLIACVDKVTIEDVNRLAGQLFTRPNPTFATVGAQSEQEMFDRISLPRLM